MSPENLGQAIEASVMIFCGLAATMIGFGLLGPEGEDVHKHDNWPMRNRNIAKIVGMGFILFGIWRLLAAYGVV